MNRQAIQINPLNSYFYNNKGYYHYFRIGLYLDDLNSSEEVQIYESKTKDSKFYNNKCN